MVMFNIFPPNMALLTIAVRCVSEARSAMKRIKVSLCFVNIYLVEGMNE